MNHDALTDPFLAKEIVDTIRDPLLVLDESLTVIYASRNFYKIFLVTEDETIGQNINELGNGQWNISDLKTLLREILTKHHSVENYEIKHHFSNIGKKTMLLNARKVISPNSSAPRILLAIEDISEKKALEEKLVRMATTDQLTGLYNRHKFNEILDDRISLSKRTNQPIALLSLDLDLFKSVNDSFGHQVGDELLKAVAHKICANIRSTDTPARLGGDEFGLIVFNPSCLKELKLLVQRIIDQISSPVVIQGVTVKVGVSIGVSLFPSHSSQKEELIKFSDEALYKAKNQGRNQYLIYRKVN